MRLQPVRFIGHKIGPFDHIELNWHKDSRGTIIIGENGTGKTTLVAAMAACLSGGQSELFPRSEFERFAQNNETYAFFEFLAEGVSVSSLVTTQGAENSYLAKIWDSLSPNIERDRRAFSIAPDQSVSLLGANPRYLSKSFVELEEAWAKNQNVTQMAAVYGSIRDIEQEPVTEYRENKDSPFKDILNPSVKAAKSEIPQWIINQFMRHALALAEDASHEADSYLDSIHRVEKFFTDSLGLPLKFVVERNPLGLEVRQNGSKIPIGQLSDGTRSYLSWILDYLSRASRVNWKDPIRAGIAPGLIIVDEIDSHLHPEWQRRVMVASSELLPETHIIATTHSPFVIGSADDTQVFRIVKDEDHKLHVESTYDELFGYPADLILQKLFTDSLYTPSIEADLERLGELAGKLTVAQLTSEERYEHDELMQKLARVSPWVANLLSMTN